MSTLNRSDSENYNDQTTWGSVGFSLHSHSHWYWSHWQWSHWRRWSGLIAGLMRHCWQNFLPVSRHFMADCVGLKGNWVTLWMQSQRGLIVHKETICDLLCGVFVSPQSSLSITLSNFILQVVSADVRYCNDKGDKLIVTLSSQINTHNIGHFFIRWWWPHTWGQQDQLFCISLNVTLLVLSSKLIQQ